MWSSFPGKLKWGITRDCSQSNTREQINLKDLRDTARKHNRLPETGEEQERQEQHGFAPLFSLSMSCPPKGGSFHININFISLHGLELSNQVEFGWTNRVARFTLADAWRQIWRKELLCRFINAFLYFNLVAWCFLSMQYVINKLVHVKSLISLLFTSF